MMFSRNVWCIVNPLRNWKLEGLSKKELELLIVTFSDLERSLCWIFRKGMTDWKKVEDFPELEYSRSFENQIRCPELPEAVRMRMSSDEEPTDNTHVLIRSQSIMPRPPERSFERFPLELPVRIVSGNKSFDATSDNLSLRGVRLKEPMPNWVAGYCTMTLVLPGNIALELLCTVAEDQGVEHRMRMEIVHSPQSTVYEDWFKSFFKAL